MVHMKNVRKVYESSNTLALDGIDLTIEDGEFVFLVGPSGSGKTTIMKLITGNPSLLIVSVPIAAFRNRL